MTPTNNAKKNTTPKIFLRNPNSLDQVIVSVADADADADADDESVTFTNHIDIINKNPIKSAIT